ncbi:tRNA-uridine aminocarboxypropyltransferase [Pseudaeromonas sharmana]|uniref:tRNA-uridine aminocarboxypropyltransferase n=1 Tax=Pseudaeromonas sharmana TaxID=328412 RepID=A0ABV8CLB4_9GAMM
MTQTIHRPRCPQCQQLQNRCFCRHVHRHSLPWPLVVLQDHREAGTAKNTVPLLRHCLPQVLCWTTQDFSQHNQLDELLRDPGRYCILVYPGESAQTPAALAPAPAGREYCFILLDGTWRQSLRLLHSHPLLLTLPRVKLTPMRASGYLIRKAPRADSLSTFEAAATLLAHWDHEAANSMLTCFDNWIAAELQHLPATIRSRYLPSD